MRESELQRGYPESIFPWMNEAGIRDSLTGTGGVRLRHLRIECPTESAAAGKSFDTDGTSMIEGGIANIAAAAMKKYLAPQHDIDAMMAHYAGDAHFQGGEILTKKGLSMMGNFVIDADDPWSSSISAVSAPYRGAPGAAKQQEP